MSVSIDGVRNRLAGAAYGAIIGDLIVGIDRETLLPIFSEKFSSDVQDFIRYMSDYSNGSFPMVDYMSNGVVTLLADVMYYGDSLFVPLFVQMPYPEPYQAACKAFYDSIFMEQGNTTWRRINRPQNDSQGLRGVSEVWNGSMSLASAALAFPDAVSMAAGNPDCDGATVGALAGARFGLGSISGRWLVKVPIDIKSIVGSFIKVCIERYKG